jgi:2-polyprenyl-6-methoxyphenol hydroxylase-like FAD-dependent oxidoreductase
MSVIIVGGGMAGATLALAISSLTQGRVAVDLVEATQPDDRAHPGFDARAIALAQGTCQQLGRIGVWAALRDCATAITHVHVSDRGHAGFVNLYAQDYQVEALGQVIELHDAGQRLFALLAKAPGVTLHCPAKVVDVLRTVDRVQVQLDNGQSLTGQLRHARENREQVDSWSDERFLSELQQAFGWRLGKMLKAGKRHSYPLSLLRANQHVSHRLALVGNAAQTLHPIAGQGFNLGLRDVMSLAETLAEAAKAGADLGAYALLSQYQQRRQQDQQATIGVTDGLIRLFANSYAPLVAGRNLGLMAMEQLPAMRDAFAKRTLGWVER